MNTKDLMEMGLKNLWRRKLRTFLTVLGVVIGTSSIVVMLSLGFGLSESQKSQIESMGSLTTINVQKSYDNFGSQNSSAKVLDEKAVLSFKNIPNVVGTMPIKTASGTILAGKYQSNIQIKGIPLESMEQFDFKIGDGRGFLASDDMVLVFGGTATDSFYNPKNRNANNPPEIDPLRDKISFTFDQSYGEKLEPGQKKINYKKYKMKAVGVLEAGNMDNDWSIFMPLNTLEKLLKEKDKLVTDKSMKSEKGYESIAVKVNDIKNVQDVLVLIKDMGYEAYSLSDFLEEMNKGAAVIQAILGGIGAVSLLVAAIGITNTMIMSIYERTKEIGIMKVIGASIKDIKRLFLFESAIIGLFGGLVGVIFSYSLSFLLNKLAPGLIGQDMGAKISIIPTWLSLAAIGFSTFIGIAAGYYPAKRAMSLSALEAIKTE